MTTKPRTALSINQRMPPEVGPTFIVPMVNQRAHAQPAPYGGATPNVSPAPQPALPAPSKHPQVDVVPVGVRR
jgi:hypothetical protein